ncbi:MAG: winged helix-turn-helix transcriptional regulator [Acidobacteriota bacterium]
MARKYNWKTGCDVEATLSVIGGRWKPVLVCHLLDGRKRFGEIRRLTPNATERMITLQLRELEADGVISRHVFAEVPPRVEYEVTEYGRSLEAILGSMQAWGKAFKERQLAKEAKLAEGACSASIAAEPAVEPVGA